MAKARVSNRESKRTIRNDSKTSSLLEDDGMR